MTVLVPFDGSELSTAALEKAAEWSHLTDEDVVALTVIPDDVEYGMERGWVERNERFDAERIATRMAAEGERVAPDATFRYEVVSSDEPTATATTNVVRAIRETATEIDASIVFVGSENVGSVTTPLSSVGGPVATEGSYDLYVVRKTE